jgi:tripartite-type tricarboxylate transporter receptor subunit TctC
MFGRQNRFVGLFAVHPLWIAAAVPVHAQIPAKPVHIVTALPAGLDAYVRVLGARFSEQIGQPVLVDNRPGGSFVIAARAVSGAPPDGSTLLIYSVIFLITKNVQPSLAFDPLADFAPVAKIYGEGASLLMVRPDSPFRTVQDLVARAKAAPGKLIHGGTLATASHLAAASLLAVAGTKGFHVPFKNAGDDIPAILRGDLDFSFGASTVVLPYVMSGKVRVLGVTSGARLRALPDVPTLRETMGSDLLVQDNWTGLGVPAKTPGEVIARWHAETVRALADPGMLKVIDAGGNQPAAGESTEQFAAFIRRENDKWRQIVKLSGLKID